jgi:glycosyltransferase involved in cell wall biosynthesis
MLPVKLLEYVTMEIPVVTTRLQVVEHYFDESMVYYVPFEDVDAIADAIRQMYSSADLRNQFVQNAKRFTNCYNWKIERQKLASVYNRLSGIQ